MKRIQVEDNMYPDLSHTLQTSFDYGTSALSKANDKERPKSVFLLGHPLQQSLAPLVHNTLFMNQHLPWTYTALESKKTQDLLDRFGDTCIGAAVTMPHKISFIALVDELTSEGAAIGAINTVFIRQDQTGKKRYIGTNTDCIGIREAFLNSPCVDPDILKDNLSSSPRPALIIGAGGACRSAIYALHRWLGVQVIYIVNRVRSEVEDIISSFKRVREFSATIRFVSEVDEARTLPVPFLVVGTVPNYPPSTLEEITASECVRGLMARPGSKDKGVVLEMCYHPTIRTAFYDFAEENGWTVIPGTETMIWQGVVQQILWTESMDVLESTSCIEDIRRLIAEHLAN